MEGYYCHENCHSQYQCKRLKDDLKEFKKIRGGKKYANAMVARTYSNDENCGGDNGFVMLADNGFVMLANNVECKVVGIGTIKVKMLDGTVMNLGKVRHVPELGRKLISLS